MQGDGQGETYGDAEGQEPSVPPEAAPGGAEHSAHMSRREPEPPSLMPDKQGDASVAPGVAPGEERDTLPPQPPPSVPPHPSPAGVGPTPPPYSPPDYLPPRYAGMMPPQPQTPSRPVPFGPPLGREPTQRHGIPWYAWVLGAVAGVLVVAVVGCCAASGLAVGLLQHLHVGSEQTETTTRTFPVSGTADLVLHDPAGNVTITPGGGIAVVVQATKRLREGFGANTSADLQAIDIQMTQSGNSVTIVARFPSVTDGADRSVDLDITTPTMTNLTLTDNAGNVTLGAISGQVDITENAGNVTATGTTLTGHSRIGDNAGNVTLDGAVANSTTLAITVNAGNVGLTLPTNTPARLSAAASVGSVSVNGWPIGVTRSGVGAKASGNLVPNPTATITVTVSSGNATIQAK